jgi:arylsulfatase A-like enzyme
LGDVLKRDSPRSRVVGVAGKDRSAVLMAGPRADAAYWYSAGGDFITSSYYTASAPAWLTAFNGRHVANRYAGTSWTRLLPDERTYLQYAGPDEVKGESDGKDNAFPHALHASPPADEFYAELSRTPFSDELVLEAALEAMSAYELGADDATDLLAVGFSATDYIGHAYGADSQEVMDQLLRLDRTLQRLLDEVQRRVGLSRTIVALTADHGALPLVEVLQSRGVPARRIQPTLLAAAVDAALKERFPSASGLVATFDGPNVYLDLDALDRQHLRRVDVEDTVRKGLLASGVVDRVYTQAELMSEPPADDPEFVLFRNAFFQPRSAHLVTRLKPYVYLGSYPGGSGHGTVQEYDRHVPVIFMGAGVKPGSYTATSGPEDVAPTLGALLGVDYPAQDGHSLRELMR